MAQTRTWPDRKDTTGRRTQNEANIKSSSEEYKNQVAKPTPQTPPPQKKRRGRPRKNPRDTPFEKTIVAREARQDSQGAATDSQPDPEEDSCQVKDGAGDTSSYVMPPRVQMSYDALVPRGLAEFLEGDLHINSLTNWSANSQQSPSRGDHGVDGTLAGKYEPFDWHWDRALPDLVTGEVLPRTGPLMQEDGKTFFWDIKNAKWQPAGDGQRETEE